MKKSISSCTIVCVNIIADTNIFLAVALDEPEKEHIIQNTSGIDLISPEILPYEIGNALSAMVKRKQLKPEEALQAEQKTRIIPVRLVAIDVQKSLKLAIKFNIYAYDAYFLHCAKSLKYPLLTFDKRMKQVANELNIEILE